MQVFEKERAETKKIKIESLNSLLQIGVPIKEANEYLELDFTIEEKENEQVSTVPGEEAPQSGSDEEGDEGEAGGAEQQPDSEEVTEETE
jgi:hypothetical protein